MPRRRKKSKPKERVGKAAIDAAGEIDALMAPRESPLGQRGGVGSGQ